MFRNLIGQIPWDQVGTEAGGRLISLVDTLSNPLKTSLGNLNKPGIPDFEGNRWRYELCIFIMFWMWYTANSPRLKKAGATAPLLDAYHRSCYEAMMRAGLLQSSHEAMRAWENDLNERFMAYKVRFENPPSEPVLFTGTLGWAFTRYLFPEEQPNPKLAWLITELGSMQFRRMSELVKDLEATYRPKWMRRLLLHWKRRAP